MPGFQPAVLLRVFIGDPFSELYQGSAGFIAAPQQLCTAGGYGKGYRSAGYFGRGDVIDEDRAIGRRSRRLTFIKGTFFQHQRHSAPGRSRVL